ncbi:hypothetical protein BDY21DRAFT_12026 [Lineolata rhizophorae]|uniref:Uncharacterized protein n=1 Tax=Lineolata rhizophorae TaxID=578093 RepID=A0A6A6PF54_9PEZI|nr:hypothetical protein BDY21DRAFT_12026 [Lineolata rhizophorae]
MNNASVTETHLDIRFTGNPTNRGALQFPAERKTKKKKKKKKEFPPPNLQIPDDDETQRRPPWTARLARPRPVLIERLDHSLLIRRVDGRRGGAVAEAEDGLDDGELGGGGVEAGDGHPVVDDDAGADDGAAAVDGAGDERHLEQRRQLVLVLHRRLGVHDAALVAEGHVRAREDVVGDGLAEDFDAEDVGDAGGEG